jgi:hypothetical protein
MNQIEPKTLIKAESIEDFLLHETFISLDELVITLNVSLNNKKFIISRDFDNNVFGLNRLEKFKQDLNSINKFRTYLGV